MDPVAVRDQIAAELRHQHSQEIQTVGIYVAVVIGVLGLIAQIVAICLQAKH